MPLEIKDVEWNETEHVLTLKVPLKGASTKNLDIFSSPNYIKVLKSFVYKYKILYYFVNCFFFLRKFLCV